MTDRSVKKHAGRKTDRQMEMQHTHAPTQTDMLTNLPSSRHTAYTLLFQYPNGTHPKNYLVKSNEK